MSTARAIRADRARAEARAAPRGSASRRADARRRADGVARGRTRARTRDGDGAATTTTARGAGARVVVFGARGGVGQVICAMLHARGYDVVAVSRGRGAEDATTTTHAGTSVRSVGGVDCRDAASIEASGALDGDVEAVVCCLGTTAFPSARWRDEDGKFTNGPEATDYVGARNVVEATKKLAPNLKRFVFVSSVGVLRTNVMPFVVLNAFGVLKWKRKGEECVEKSGLPYTILRPGRLTDGPYTSYDLNTLLKATSGTRRDVQIGGGDDKLLPEATSRLVVAEAACAALECASAAGRAYELGSTEGGDGPQDDAQKWQKLFDSV